MKKIWMTSLDPAKEPVQKLMARMKPYGIEVAGHFFSDDLEKMSWTGARDELLDSGVALWVILASYEQLFTPSTLYGLSLLTIILQAKRGGNFPIVILQTTGDAVSSGKLPTPLKGAAVFSVSTPGLEAKLVAKANVPAKKTAPEYHMDCYANVQIGQWIEVGPVDASWKGAMAGVAGAGIVFQAVGPRGELPKKSELNYPVKGMKLTLGDKEYTAWAVQNEIDPGASYFVKIDGHPESIIFGSYAASGEEAEVYVVRLK